MDAREYDRIADLLMQIRKKINSLEPKYENAKKMREEALQSLEWMLICNDILAKMDTAGWL